MNVRTAWASQNSLDNGYNQFYTLAETISDVQENFDIRRYHSNEGYSVTVTNDSISATPTATEQVLIQWYTNPLNGNKEDIKIHFTLDSIITIGSLITWNNKKYLIAAKVKSNQAYKSSQMLECNNTLNFYDQSNVLYQIPCVLLDKFSVSLEETKYFSMFKCDTVCLVANTSTNLQIPSNYIFKIGVKNNYRTLLIDDATKSGILIIPMEYTTDAVVIPTVEVPEDSGTDYILSGVDSIKVGYTKTYTAEKYVDGVFDNTADFTFSIVDTGVPTSAYTLAIVNNTSCTITCKTDGYTLTLRATESGNNTDKSINLIKIF